MISNFYKLFFKDNGQRQRFSKAPSKALPLQRWNKGKGRKFYLCKGNLSLPLIYNCLHLAGLLQSQMLDINPGIRRGAILYKKREGCV